MGLLACWGLSWPHLLTNSCSASCYLSCDNLYTEASYSCKGIIIVYYMIYFITREICLMHLAFFEPRTETGRAVVSPRFIASTSD